MSHRRSFIMFAIMIVVMSTLLVATGVIFLVQAESRSSHGVIDSAQSRAIAWSGLQAVMAELQDQRSDILKGDFPSIGREFTIYRHGAEEGVARLLPVVESGEVLVGESARIDLNEATPERLKATGILEDTEVDSIIAERGGGYAAVSDLLKLSWVDDRRFYGDLPDGRWTIDDGLTRNPRAATAVPVTVPLSQQFSVFSFEPEITSKDTARININANWTKRLRDRLAQATTPEFADAVAARRTTDTIKSLGDVYQIAKSAGVQDERLNEVFDAIRLSAESLRGGQVNVHRASREVLLSVPGLNAELVDAILQTRESLSDEDRQGLAWLLTREVLTPSAFDVASAHLTTRSMTFRVRIGALVREDEDQTDVSIRTVLEAVIDCVDQTPRLAMVRNISQLPALATVMQSLDESPSDVTDPDMSTPADEPSRPAATESSGGTSRQNEPAPGSADKSKKPKTMAPPTASVRRRGRWTAD